MQAISPERSSFAPTAVVSLVTFAALALLGLVLAYWTWAWLAPRPEPRAQPLADPVGRIVSANSLFGIVQRDQNIAAPAESTVRLLGVVAASGSQSSYAVFRLDAKQTVAVREGAEIEPGVRLAEVHADHVVLERSGVRTMLAWPQQNKPAVAAVPRTNN